MSFQPDTIIITSDEPYSPIWHTQLIYAAFLGKTQDVVYVNPPSKWKPINLLRVSKAITKPDTENFTIFSYRNLLPVLNGKFFAINEIYNTFLMARYLKKRKFGKVLIWHFDSYRGLFNSNYFRQQFAIKHVYHVIDPYYNNPLNDQLASISELIVLTSPANNAYYKRHEHKLLNIPQSVDPALSQLQLMSEPPAFVPHSPFIVLLGTISDDLEFDWLLDLVQDPTVYLLIIGNVKSLSRHVKDLEELLKHKNVTYTGPLPPAAFYPILKRAKAGLVLYNRERREFNFSPLKAVNYLVAGIPVISNCNCEIPALLDQCIYEVTQYNFFREKAYKSLENDLAFSDQKATDYLDAISIEKAVERIFERNYEWSLEIKDILAGAMKNKKVRGVIFISNVTKAMEHEWFVDFTDRTKFDFEFVLFNSADSPLYNYITSKGFVCRNYALPSSYWVPFYILFFAGKLLVKRPDFVHCHLFLASVIGISAAKLAVIRKRIYTRHHTDVHHVYNPHAVKYDKMVNALSTHIIAVSKNSASILQKLENVPAEKITIINHGIPLKLIDKHVPPAQIEEMRKKYQLQDNFPIVGVISRFVPEKGIQYIIPSFKLLLNDFPEAKLVLANARGNYERQVLSLLEEIPKKSYVLIPFELNVDPLFKNFDVFVHAPIDETCEAFGQVYIEALSMGIPMVCTISGIASDLIIHERNALVAEYKNAASLYEQIKKMLNDETSRRQITTNGKEDVKEHTFEKKFEKILHVYLN